jgi:hypothetical protein
MRLAPPQAINKVGTVAAKPKGRATRSDHIEDFSDVTLSALVSRKCIGRVELAELLRTQHGVSFRASIVWRAKEM